MKYLFAPLIPVEDDRNKHSVPKSLLSIHEAVLYISGEVEKKPRKYPLYSKDDKEKQHRMKQMPNGDKLMEKLCLMTNHALNHRVRHMTIKFLTFHQYLVDVFFNFCTSKLSKFYGMIRIILLILTNKKNKQTLKLFDEKYRDQFTKIILKEIIEAKSPPPMRVREAFGLFFTKVRVSEFDQVFSAELERMLKRSPAETSKTCIVIFSNLKNIGTGDIHHRLAPLLLSEFKSKDTTRRANALKCFQIYSGHLNTVKDLEMAIGCLKKAAKGDVQIDERLLYIKCFKHLQTNCSRALSNDEYKEFSNTLVAALCSILNKETNEETRESLLDVIDTVVLTMNQYHLPHPESAIKMLITCLEGKNNGQKTVAATVRVLVNVLEQKNKELLDTLRESTQVWAMLTKCITKAKSSPKESGKDGLAAILAILYLCDGNEKLFEKHSKKVLDIINEAKSHSFFNFHGYIWHDEWDVTMVRVQIIEKLILKSKKAFFLSYFNATTSRTAFKGVWGCLLNCTLCMDYRVRRFACDVIRRVNAAGLQIKNKNDGGKLMPFSWLMVNNLHQYVSNLLVGQACYQHPDKVKTGEMGQHEDIPVPIAFGDCLRAIAGDEPSKHSLIYILYLAHYPWFSQQPIRGGGDDSKNESLWNSIMDQWTRPKNPDEVKFGGKMKRKKFKIELSQEQKEQMEDQEKDLRKSVRRICLDVIKNNAIMERLIREDLTRVQQPIAQRAIMDTMACVFKIEPTLITQNRRILEDVDRVLKTCGPICDFTEKEKRICNTPEGVLCTFDDEHKARDNSKNRKKKKKKKNNNKTPPQNQKKGKNKPKKDINDKILLKPVAERGTTKLQTDEEWEAEQRRQIALMHGGAKKQKEEKIAQQSQVRKKLALCQSRMDSIFKLFRALMMISRKDFADHMAQKYLSEIIRYSVSELLRESIIDGVNTILQSLSPPIRNQSKSLAILLVRKHVEGDKFWEDSSTRQRLATVIARLKKDSSIPDVKLVSDAELRRRKQQKNRPTRSIRGRGGAMARGRGRGIIGRGGIRGRGRGVVGVRGRGRGVTPRGRGRGVVAARGRGRGIPGMGASRGARGGIRGRGRGIASRGGLSSVPGAEGGEEQKEEKEMEKDATPEATDLFTQSYDVSKRWTVPSFVVLFSFFQSCLVDTVNPRTKKPKFSFGKTFQGHLLSMLTHHCHDRLNVGKSFTKFPTTEVSLLLLQCITFYKQYIKVCAWGLAQLSPSMQERPKKAPKPSKPPSDKAGWIKLEITNSEMRSIIHMDGCLSRNKEARYASLCALAVNRCILYPQSDLIRSRVWILKHDQEGRDIEMETNTKTMRKADSLWSDSGFAFEPGTLEYVIAAIGNPAGEVRKAIAESIGDYCTNEATESDSVRANSIKTLIAHYKSHKDELRTDPLDKNKKFKVSKWTFRDGCSRGLGFIANYKELEKHLVMVILDFLLKFGISEADNNVYKQNLDTGRSLMLSHGAKYPLEFFQKLEMIQNKVKNAQTVQSDWVRQGCVIYTACLVEQIEYDPSDDEMNTKIGKIMNALVTMITVPNVDVQHAVCDSLQHLITRPNIKANAKKLSSKLLQDLGGKQLPGRQGAARAIAAMVRGLKIPSVSNLGIMDALAKMVNSKDSCQRQGALFCYRELFETLGTAFEPFVIKVLPHLLTRFGDDNGDVRKATAQAAKAVMKNLSNFGIKMVLPLILVALDKPDARMKVQSCTMLGQMAFCAPKVLATYLPQIIPKLNNTLQDPKSNVSSAAKSAMKNIGSVVRNPEIASLVPLLLDSITRGGEHTKKALRALINTSFTNVVDVPSLALVIPILTNAMSDRSSQTKKMAAQVIGGICQLIAEPKSIVPYIPELIVGIKSILCDPIPEVRNASAMAIRSLNESLGDENNKDLQKLYPYLMGLLKDEKPTKIQQFGAAQGLSEYIASYHSDEKVGEILPVILEGLQDKIPEIRESFCQVFVYFPRSLDTEFPYWMEQCVPPLLQLLGDDKEPVRSCALKALKITVYKFHQTEFDLMLELLEEGLEFSDYRVRDSTLILIGDLLNGLAGNEGSVSYETNATADTESRILDYLGNERRNEVFSVLYMARSDCEQPVRARANITWKGLVYNSSRMLKAILDTLMHLLITALSSHNRDRQRTGSKSLGDLVRNAAQFVLPKIVPVLRKGLQSESEDDAYKEGIALGLSEVLQNAHAKLIEEYETELIESISLGIRDRLLRVRNASGKAFNVAVKVFGSRCINRIVPDLVESLHIEGLKQLLQSPPKTCEQLILPFLIRELLEKNEELKAISLLARDLNEHCGGFLHKYIADIFKSVCNIVAKHSEDEDGGEEMLKYGNKIIIDGVPSECTHLLLTTAIEFVTSGSLEVPDESKIVALSLISGFVKNSRNEFHDNIPQLMKGVLELFDHQNDGVRLAAWNTLKDILSVIPDEEIAGQIDWFRQCIRTLTNNGKKKSVAGFCIKNGLKPVMTMFDYGLRNGTFEEREAAAKMMAELISLSNLDAVKPFLNKIAGALIRICADRFPSNVKCAILQTLSLLISKYGALMKGFYTPLQTTFVKVIHDPSRDVRGDAADAILELMAFSTKFDNLLRDLNNYLKRLDADMDGDADKGITISILSVMSKVLLKVGSRVKPQILADVQNTFSLSDSFRSERDDSLRAAASKCVASAVHCMADENAKHEMIVDLLDIDEEEDWRSIEYDLNSLAFIIADETVYTREVHESYSSDIATTFEAFLENPQVLVLIAALRTGYYFVGRVAEFEDGEEAKLEAMRELLDKHLLPLLSSKVNNGSEDVVISSIEFLMEAMLRGDEDEDANGGGEGEEDEEKGGGEKNGRMDEIWRNYEIHAMIIPFVVENHSNNVQPALMRKCLTTLLNIDLANGAAPNLKHYNFFVANCNDKSVVGELKAIVEALTN